MGRMKEKNAKIPKSFTSNELERDKRLLLKKERKEEAKKKKARERKKKKATSHELQNWHVYQKKELACRDCVSPWAVSWDISSFWTLYNPRNI